MVELDPAKATTTDLKGKVDVFSVSAITPDQAGIQKETFWDYPDASKNLGYFHEIPEFKSAILALTIWVCGKGWEADSRVTAILESITGWGEDSFQSVCQNLIIQKKVFGDAFAEIIRNDTKALVNLKPLYPGNMRVVVNPKGMIDHYEQRNGDKIKPFRPEQILHIVNDRIANEIHGTSVLKSLKFIIDAKREALEDERKIRHRELALGVLEIDTDDTTKQATVKTQYQDAVNKGEVLVLPKGIAQLKDSPNAPRDRVQWLQYLDNLFYQVVGVPKVIVTSEGFTEAGGKVGFLTFEPVYTTEQTELEADLWNQVAIRVKFNRPPSLAGMMRESEEKNTGQTGFQPTETQVTATRTE